MTKHSYTILEDIFMVRRRLNKKVAFIGSAFFVIIAS